MPDYHLFINGIYRRVLEDILATQSVDPNHTLFLQPYSASPIARLKNNPPSPEDPVTLYVSTTDELAIVSYTAEIVGWEDKTEVSQARRDEVESILASKQPSEGGLYGEPETGIKSLNLLSIRRLTKFDPPFSVAELVKLSDGNPLSTNRSRAGGWSYVRKRDTGA